jgi:hypothetical protein
MTLKTSHPQAHCHHYFRPECAEVFSYTREHVLFLPKESEQYPDNGYKAKKMVNQWFGFKTYQKKSG